MSPAVADFVAADATAGLRDGTSLVLDTLQRPQAQTPNACPGMDVRDFVGVMLFTSSAICGSAVRFRSWAGGGWAATRIGAAGAGRIVVIVTITRCTTSCQLSVVSRQWDE